LPLITMEQKTIRLHLQSSNITFSFASIKKGDKPKFIPFFDFTN